jgi:hypothetical protein
MQLSSILSIREFNFQRYYDVAEERGSRSEDILSLCQTNPVLHNNLITPKKLSHNPVMAHCIFADGLFKPNNILPTTKLRTRRWTKAACLGLAEFIMKEQRDQIQSVLWFHSCITNMSPTMLKQFLDIARPLLTIDLLCTPTAYFTMLRNSFNNEVDSSEYNNILRLEEHDPGLHSLFEDHIRPFKRLVGQAWGDLGWPERYFGLIMKTYKRLIRGEQIGIDPSCLPILLIVSCRTKIPEEQILKRFSIHASALQQLTLSPLCAVTLYKYVPFFILKSLEILDIVKGILKRSLSFCPVELLGGLDRYIRWRRQTTLVLDREYMLVDLFDVPPSSEMSHQELEELLRSMTENRLYDSRIILNDIMPSMVHLPGGQLKSVSDAFIYYARYAIATTGFLTIPGAPRPTILLTKANRDRWNIFIISWAYMLVHNVRFDTSNMFHTIPDEATVCEFVQYLDCRPCEIQEQEFKRYITVSCESYGLEKFFDFGTLRGMLHADSK